MAASQVLEDVLIHPDRHSEPEREFTLEVALYQLRRPLTTDEAAGVLGVSKPTVLSWVKAGLLPPAGESRPRRVLLDPAAVFAAKRVLKGARLRGSPAQRVLRLAELAEAIFWATHPEDLSALQRSLEEADAGGFVEVEDDLIDLARARLARSTRDAVAGKARWGALGRERWARLRAAARTDDRLTTVIEALAEGIARLETNPCIGVRLRGLSIGRELCELRINRERKSWRIIYEVRPPGPAAYLHLVGEHYLPTQASTFFGNPKAPRTRLAVRAGLPDVYVDLARYLALTEAEIRAMLAEIERGLKQPACC